MPKPVKEAAPAGDTGLDLPFEDALKKLETILESMESDELPLETLLARYEEGSRLALHCQGRLAEAELKIQRLERSANGQFNLKNAPINPSAEA